MALRKLKPTEANDGTYGGMVLGAFDRLNEAMNPDFNAILSGFAAAQRLAARISRAAEQDAAEPVSCECDYDAQGDPLEYVKTSRYCPVHDDCESCGERKGVAKDPSFPVGYDLSRIKRPFWTCQTCLDEMCHVCGMDLEGGCKTGGKCTKTEPTIADFERAVYAAKVQGGKA